MSKNVMQGKKRGHMKPKPKSKGFKNAGSSTWQQTPSTRKKGGY